MRVPQITADPGLRGGNDNVTASPEAFAPIQGLTAFAHGMQTAAGAVEEATSAREQLKRQRQHEDSITWASSQLEAQKRSLNEWMANPDNHSKEGFADDFLQTAKEHAASVQGAPTPLAARLFKSQFDSYVTSSHETALQTAEKTRLLNKVDAFNGQVDNALDAYRAANKIPGVDGGSSLLSSLDSITKNIDLTFGKTAPQTAAKLKDRAVQDAAFATMDQSPELARKILASSKTLDEHTRWTMTNHIEQVEKSRMANFQANFDNMRESVVSMTKFGNNQNKIDIGEYKKFYPESTALHLKATDDNLIDRFNGANDFMTKNAGKAAPALLQALSDLRTSITTNKEGAGTRADIYDIVSRKAADIIQTQDKDPVTWLIQDHPVVKGLYQKAQDSLKLGNKLNRDGIDDSISARMDFYNSLIRFQGPPPVGTSEVDKALYLGRPQHAIHLMNAQQAEQAAQSIHEGAPSEVLDRINQVLVQYPTETQQNLAFNDIVTLPKEGIKQEYQYAFLNRHEPWIKFYLGSLQNADAVKNVTPDEQQKFEDAINAEPTWNQFSRTLTRDNLQRLEEVNGFKSGLKTLAMARSYQYGESPKRAVAEAAKQLISSNLGSTTINGVPVFFPRERPMQSGERQPDRTDEDMAGLGRRLEDALVFVDPSKFNLRGDDGRLHWPATKDLTPEQRNKAIKDDIMAHGFFQPSPDGQSVTLYYHNGQEHFEIRDEKNKAFSLYLEDVPDFTKTTVLPPMDYYDHTEPGRTVTDKLIKKQVQAIQGNSNQTNWYVNWQMIDRKQAGLIAVPLTDKSKKPKK